MKITFYVMMIDVYGILKRGLRSVEVSPVPTAIYNTKIEIDSDRFDIETSKSNWVIKPKITIP